MAKSATIILYVNKKQLYKLANRTACVMGISRVIHNAVFVICCRLLHVEMRLLLKQRRNEKHKKKNQKQQQQQKNKKEKKSEPSTTSKHAPYSLFGSYT